VAAQAKRDVAVPVTVGLVVQKPEPVQIRAIGNVQQYSTVQVKAQVAGELVSVYFKEGEYVRRGDRLFTIDPRPYQAALQQAQANRNRDAAQAASAEADAQRYAALVKKGVIARQQYDQAEANAKALSAAVASGDAAIETARLQLGYTEISSPIDGRTGSLLVQAGNLIKANDVPLVVINQVEPIYVSFAVPGPSLDAIRQHMTQQPLRVEAIPNDNGPPSSGTLTFVDNNIDLTTGTIQLKGTFPNHNHLLWPGEFVHASLTLTVQNAVVVPSPAVQTSQQGQFVFVIGPDMRVQSRPVVVNRIVGQETVIDRGLQPGEKVVTDGQLRLVPGARITIAPPAGGEVTGT
jgi:multidrug efflux system membrane fusion protein